MLFKLESDHAVVVLTDDITNPMLLSMLKPDDSRKVYITYFLTEDFDEWELENIFDMINKLPKCKLIIDEADPKKKFTLATDNSETLIIGLRKPKYKALLEMQGALDHFATPKGDRLYSLNNVSIYYRC